MAYNWKRAPIRDTTARELRRLRVVTERHLRERRQRARLVDIDAYLWRYWYRLPEDVCDRLGPIVAARDARRANATSKRSWRAR